MNVSLRVIAKFCFLLVIICFLMPIACDMNGFKLADTFMQMDNAKVAMLLYVLFASALAGLVIGVLIMKIKIPVTVDWLVIIVCIGSGIMLLLENSGDLKLQSCAYMMAAGFILTLLVQIISTVKKEA